MSNLGGGLRQIDWGTQRLEKFEKNFYIEDKRVSSRSEREVEDFRRLKEMRVRFFFFVFFFFFFSVSRAEIHEFI
jgi:ATP-dependent RNA helicase DDX5/DBP2